MIETTDIWFATYIIEVKNIPLEDYSVISRGKGRFKFDISSEELKSLKLEFINSETSKVKQGQERLKDLLY